MMQHLSPGLRPQFNEQFSPRSNDRFGFLQALQTSLTARPSEQTTLGMPWLTDSSPRGYGASYTPWSRSAPGRPAGESPTSE